MLRPILLALVAATLLQAQTGTGTKGPLNPQPEEGGGAVNYGTLKAEVEALFVELKAAAQAFRAAGTPGSFQADPKLLAPFRSKAEASTGERREAYMLVEALVAAQVGLESRFVGRILQEVPPTSSAWKAAPDLATILESSCGKDAVPYLAKMKEKGVLEVRGPLCAIDAFGLATTGDSEGARAMMARAVGMCPDDPQVKMYRMMLEGELKVPVGKPAPSFTIPDLEHPGKTYSLADFKGMYLLMDFWGTWCGWCVKELPETHKAYERFKGRGFEILSLAKEAKAETVMAFRKKPEFPMPWKHGLIAPGEDLMLDAYGVTGFPSLFLIGPDGTVVAKGEGLRGDGLEKTLEGFIK